ncbi:alpha/beta hydrolase [Roseivirga echinicomitans]
MKKFFKVMIIGLLLVVAAFYFLVLPYTVKLMTNYDRHTFEHVLSDTALVAKYGIGENRNPADYGFSNFEEVDFKTLTDGIDLNGWYVPASKAGISQTLMINHGRTSNRLKTMKYLALVKETGLDSLYNIFIPDLRNSGKSDDAETALGYEFAEDITGAMKMLKDQYEQNEFVLWGFSMGAMASAIAVNRPDLVEFIQSEGLKVDKLILDSPLSNIYATTKAESENMGIPGFIFDMSFNQFDHVIDDWAENMKFSYLLSHNPLPTLILYGNGDSTTPASILEAEIEGLSNVQAELFEGAGHVLLYTRPEYKDRYTQAVNDFLRK